MKTLKTLCVLLLMVTGAMAQINPDNMFISGYIVDTNGQAQAGATVCVSYVSNSPVLPSDTVCTNTNSNGYYFIDITNGSLSGPNVYFEVTTYDSCSFLPLSQTVINAQGTIDTAMVDFVICSTGGCNLQVSIVSSYDSLNNSYLVTAGPGGFVSYSWSTGDSTQTIEVQPSPNGEVVCVTVTDANGCTATTCDTLYPNGNPTPCTVYFTPTVDSILGALVYTFNATSYPISGSYTYEWEINNTTILGNPVTYQAGPNEIEFDACLTSFDANGDQCGFLCESFIFGGSNGTCDVIIEANTSNNPNGLAGLSAIATGTPPFTYAWSTGEISPSVTIFSPGVYCVTVTDATGCSFTACDTLLPINPSGCQAGFSYQSGPNGELLVGDTVQLFFDGVAGSSSTYSWTLSAGGFSFNATGMNPYYVIPPTLLPVNGMNVEICVTVTDSVANCTDAYCETVLAVPSNNNNCGGTITTTVDSTLLGVTYTFTANATGIAPFMYNWFNGDSSQSIVIESSQIPWGNACVAITDATGCTITVCDTLSPNNNNCQANYSWEINTALGVPLTGVQFTDLSLGNATFWYWEFGDGATSTDQNPLHLYNGDGPFTVCLTVVTANQQCQSTYCDSLYLGTNPGNCSALFTNSGLTPIGYTFSANVQNPNLDYYWTIDNQYGGDGYEAYAPGLTNGVHTVCLSVVDSLNNCFDQQCQTITIGSPNCYGYISGQVYAGTNNQPLFDGVVYLITFDANTNQLTVVDSIVLDTSNSFFFGALACGDYLIKAAAYSGSPYYSNHIPTYHGNSPFWGLAQTLTLGQVNTQITADVTLIAANNPGGPGFIGGDVTQGANKTDPGDPLSGIQVMLFNLNGGAIAYTYTDENGEFGFADLAYGTYQVYVEVLGVQTIPAVVTIGPDEPSEENVHIFASETLISTGIEEVDFDGAISNVYPNPVVNEASITFNLDAEVIINVSVLDLTGRAISTQMVSIAGGENTLRVNSENLQNGYYFLNIQDVEGNFSVTRKFMRID